MKSVTTLASVEARRDLFRDHAIRSGEFALRYIEKTRHDDAALGRQRDNILQAMDACDRYAGAWEIVLRIALNLHDHMERQGYWEVWERSLGRAVEASRKLGETRAEGTLLNCLGQIRRGRGQWESALSLHEAARAIFEGLQDEDGIAKSHQHLGCLWWQRGRWESASAHFDVALDIAERCGKNESSLAELYGDVGRLCSYKGEWGKALDYFQQAADITACLGDIPGEIRSHSSMGYAHWRRGEWTEAKRRLEWATEMSAQYGYETGLAIACNNLAAVLLSQGEWERALTCLRRELKIVEPIGAVHLAAHAYDDMGEAYRQAEQWEQAWDYLDRSVEIKRQLDDLSGLAATYHHMGLLCTDTSEHQRALDYHGRALALREKLQAEQDIAEVLVSLAWALYHRLSTGLTTDSSTFRQDQGEGKHDARDQLWTVVERARTLAGSLHRHDLLARLMWLEAEDALAAGRTEEAQAAFEQALKISRPPISRPPDAGGSSYGNDRLAAIYHTTQERIEALRAAR